MPEPVPTPALPPPLPPPLPRGRGKHATRARANKARSASYWVLAIAILQFLFGAFFAVKANKEADEALQHLARFADDEPLEVEGETITAGQLRRDVERERLQQMVMPFAIGATFLALFFWARRSPLPALSTALALFVTVHAIAALDDPKNLARGIIMKVFCVVALVGGIKSALQQRVLEQRDADAVA